MQSYLPTPEKSKECKERINKFKADYYNNSSTDRKEQWNTYINSLKQAEIIRDYPYITGVYYDGSFNYTDITEYLENIGEDLITLNEMLPNKEIVWILPQILLDKELAHINEIIDKLKLRNIQIKIQTDNIGVAKNLDTEKYGNHLNVYNNYTIKQLSQDPEFKRLMISNEISYEDIKLLRNAYSELEYTLFGHLQLMITKDDFNDLIDEEITNTYYIIDKRNNKYLIIKYCYKNSHIYDYRILNLEDHIEKLRKTDLVCQNPL